MSYTDVLISYRSFIQDLIAKFENVDQVTPDLVRQLAEINQTLSQANPIEVYTSTAENWRSKTITQASAQYTTHSSGFYLTVPAGKEWQLQAGYISVVTSATTGGRNARFLAPGAFVPCPIAQDPSQTRYYLIGLYPLVNSPFWGNWLTLPFPPVILAAGEQFTFSLEGKKSDDTITPTIKIMERTV